MEEGPKTIRCDCDECEDGKRAPMGKLYPDGSMRFIKRYGGKYHKVDISLSDVEPEGDADKRDESDPP